MGDPCDACGEEVRVAGGISGMWGGGEESTGGLTLEFEDGSEQFLCFDCVERLPDHPTADDVAALRESRGDGG